MISYRLRTEQNRKNVVCSSLPTLVRKFPIKIGISRRIFQYVFDLKSKYRKGVKFDDMLEEYANTFAYWGSVSMLPFFLCPLMTCWYIIKVGFADFFEPVMFIDGLVRSLLFYQYAKLFGCPNMMQSNLFGVVLSVIYILVYFHYLKNEMKFYKTIMKWASFTVIVFLYVNWVSRELASVHIEYILAIYNVFSMIHPFQGLKFVYEKKCTFGVPYLMVFAGQIACTFWLLFAISVHNYLLMVQLFISFILGAIQIVFCFIYPFHSTFVRNHSQT